MFSKYFARNTIVTSLIVNSIESLEQSAFSWERKINLIVDELEALSEINSLREWSTSF